MLIKSHSEDAASFLTASKVEFFLAQQTGPEEQGLVCRQKSSKLWVFGFKKIEKIADFLSQLRMMFWLKTFWECSGSREDALGTGTLVLVRVENLTLLSEDFSMTLCSRIDSITLTLERGSNLEFPRFRGLFATFQKLFVSMSESSANL